MSGAPDPRRPVEAVRAAHGPCGPWYLLALALSGGLAALGAFAASLLLRDGLHRTGMSRPVGWGALITNFVFWVGIAHAGTLVSAILVLFRARFRTAVNRVAELMTVVAIATAALFPVLHLGRPWLAYWLFPFPGQRRLWVNFRSPLVWDVFAVTTYLVVSVVFLLFGVVPDAAALRRGATGWRRLLYRALSPGWRGTDEQWRHHTRAHLLFAALVTPLVVSVHSVVSWDFAVSLLPGWHSTLFPPYFVAGAILSGVAMVLTILVPLRRALGVEDLVTARHVDLLARLVILTAAVVAYCYALELGAALSAPPADAERAVLLERMTGSRAPLFWLMVACNCVGPGLLLVGRLRRSMPFLLLVCVAVNVGMWLERFTIIVSSLSHDRLPFTWRGYRPTWVEWTITAGALGWFLFLFLVGLKLLPPFSVAELREEADRASSPRFAPPRGGEENPGEQKVGAPAPSPRPPPPRGGEGISSVLGAFREPAAAAAAVRALRGRGLEVRAAMPAAFPEVMAALGRPRSALDLVTLPAALLGLGCGALLAAGGALAWPIFTGGKPILSLPPFAVIAFEVAVLVGSLANLAAFAVAAWRGRGRAPAVDLADGRIGVLAVGAEAEAGEAEGILRAHGAEEVRRAG